jgi:putative transcriptional regulator
MKSTVAQEIIEGLRDFAGALKNKEVAKQFTCHRVVLELEPATYDPEMVRQTRTMLGASQSVFAQFLGVSIKTIHAWEQGTYSPKQVACRFMDEIRRNPAYWRKRLSESVVSKKARSERRRKKEAI